MDKAIVVISGTPNGKDEFIKIAKQTCWVWQVNPKKFISKIASKNFGVDTENNYEIIQNMSNLLNPTGFERTYVMNLVQKFLQDDSETKCEFANDNDIATKRFDRFVLIIHGISRELIYTLKEDYGAFCVGIFDKNMEGTGLSDSSYDFILHKDDEDFSSIAMWVLNVFTHKQEIV